MTLSSRSCNNLSTPEPSTTSYKVLRAVSQITNLLHSIFKSAVPSHTSRTACACTTYLLQTLPVHRQPPKHRFGTWRTSMCVTHKGRWFQNEQVTSFSPCQCQLHKHSYCELQVVCAEQECLTAREEIPPGEFT